MRAVTFGELIDETLSRLGFAGETGSLRDVAKSVIRASHEERVLSRDWNFMRMPAPSTLTTTSGQRSYTLSPYFRTPIWFRDTLTGEPLVEARSSMQMDNLRPLASATEEQPFRFELRGQTTVWNQPTAAGVATAASSEAASDAGNTVTLEGLDENGSYATETLTLPAVGSTQFSVVTAIRKNGAAADWAGTLSVVIGTVTLATFAPTNFGTYLRQIYLLYTPSEGRSIEYDFWRLPNDLEEDNDLPSIPAPFSRVLVYDALLAMVGYSRATQAEMKVWEGSQEKLSQAMEAAYEEGQSNHAEADFIHVIPR